MTAWQLVLAGTGGAVAFAVLFGSAVGALGRLLDRSRDWRLDHHTNREQS